MKTKHLSLSSSALLLGAALGATFIMSPQKASAACYFIACPAPQPTQAPPVYREAPKQIIINKTYITKGSYSAGYKAGYKAAKNSKAATKRVTRTVAAHKSRNYKMTSHSSYYGSNMRDRAASYHAAPVGGVIPVAALGGRGDQYVVQYATPANIQIINGQRCGWANPIGGGSRNAWVCHCASGWLPPSN